MLTRLLKYDCTPMPVTPEKDASAPGRLETAASPPAGASSVTQQHALHGRRGRLQEAEQPRHRVTGFRISGSPEEKPAPPQRDRVEGMLPYSPLPPPMWLPMSAPSRLGEPCSPTAAAGPARAPRSPDRPIPVAPSSGNPHELDFSESGCLRV